MSNLAFVCLLLAALLTPLSVAVVHDVLLFAGQSNAIGWPNGAGISLEALVPVLRNHRDESQRADLIAEIMKAEASGRERAETEADLLLEMADNYPGIWNRILDPVPNAYCSFLNVRNGDLRPRRPTNIGYRSTCGNSWGPELMIGKTIENLRSFAVRKIAGGGSTIQQWRPNPGAEDGEYWSIFSSTTANLKGAHPDCKVEPGCQYRAFIWFQGINNAWTNDPTIGLNYENELSNFVNATREVMHEAGSSYSTAAEIPIVIVQIGQFGIGGNFGMNVARAQSEFCASEPSCILVETSDLSQFYHYEAAALLIIGERIARALDELLPPPPPTTSPTPAAPTTKKPTKQNGNKLCVKLDKPCKKRVDCCNKKLRCRKKLSRKIRRPVRKRRKRCLPKRRRWRRKRNGNKKIRD